MKTSAHEATQLAEAAIRGIAEATLPHASLYLFGSRARGSATRRSDFDLAVMPKQGFEERELVEFTEQLEASSDIIYAIDVVDWRETASELRYKIEQEGRLWKN